MHQPEAALSLRRCFARHAAERYRCCVTQSEIGRRGFLRLAAGSALTARHARAAGRPFADRYFLPILEGFLRNAVRTSDSFAVCDFPDGTKLPGALAASGKTYDSVSRMMPAVAAWVASRREPAKFTAGDRETSLDDVLLAMFVNAFDPNHPDYWRAAPPGKQHQLQVESSIVAWSLFIARGRLLPRMTAPQRANVQNWLASCTRVPVRDNNWAWFTALNQAVRIALSSEWPEFNGDADWMIEDLKVLDRMAIPGSDGWYTDSVREEVYDYYNFWVFASHFLYWNRVIGSRYPDWSARFSARLQPFLKNAPYFFGANGSHILFGRSLIYRWAVLTPLVLAYEQNLWPHSAGLLRAIVRRNLDYLWGIGGFDARRGKLLESLSPDGTLEIRESYIDNGHPYWGMQAFSMYLIPPDDPFWTAAEEPLPVEKRSFAVHFEGPKMTLRGDRESGEVRWIHSVNGHNESEYRDKYTKLSYSSHFPFSIVKEKGRCPLDAALVFRDPRTNQFAGRSALSGGRLIEDGVEREWSAKLGTAEIRVKTTVRYSGWYEIRRHEVEAPEGTEILEGSYGLNAASPVRQSPARGTGMYLRARGGAVALHGLRGFDSASAELQEGANVVHARVMIAVLHAVAKPGVTVLESVHYASVRPKSDQTVERESRRLATPAAHPAHSLPAPSL
jgi:hypothetical protein